MEDEKIGAGNLSFIVKQFHTNLGEGVSVDILARGPEQDVSMIRLDWSADKPHYHYNPGAENTKVIALDPAIIDDSMNWFLARITDRLPFMIRRAGYSDVAQNINAEELQRAIHEVKRVAGMLVKNVMVEKSAKSTEHRTV